MKQNFKFIIILSILLAVYIFICAYSYVSAISNNLADSVFRLHIIANSNSKEDQKQKANINSLVMPQIINAVNDSSDIDDARKLLQTIKGVGPKVAECALLFGFYRTEAFPKDVWVKRVMANWYPDGLPECTKGVEGIAQQYLFHYIRTSGTEI